MSNRSLMEINHDKSYRVEDSPTAFAESFMAYVNSGDIRTAIALEYFGVRVIGMKHHSDGHSIEWGGIIDKEDSN